MDNYGFRSDKNVILKRTLNVDSESQKQEFVSDKFDDIKTLQKKEINLLGDLHSAHKDRNLEKFLNLLHSTGYKPTPAASRKTLLKTLGLQKFRTSRRLLFERECDKESLFEEILQTPGSSKFIKLIWNECELWRSSDVLTEANPKGWQPIDYIIKSRDHGNLLAFLMFDFDEESDSVTKAHKKYVLKLKNEQFKVRTGQSLFKNFYSIHDQQSKKVCLIIMEKLLREMQRIDDIDGETAIDEVLQIADEIYKHEILKLLVTFCSADSHDDCHYREILSKISPFYKLLLSLQETQENEFEELFEKYLEAMKEKHGDQLESIVQDDCNSLLEFALNKGQRKVIDVIVNCDLIDANKVLIKSDMSSIESKDAQYLMARLLENGYYLGNCGTTNDWLTSQVLKDFLDSRVSVNGFLGCEVDYNFLINPNIRGDQMKSDCDNNGKLLFSRGMQPLENILDNERLRSSITHPVLATFINLKYWKFRRIFFTNFFIFLFLYVLPFFFFFMLLPFRREFIETFHSDYPFVFELIPVLRNFCLFSTTFLTLREIFQLFVANFFWKDYFKKKANLLEIVIVVMSWSLLYIYKAKKELRLHNKSNEYQDLVRIEIQISASIIILATVELLIILPYRSMTIYMFMMKQVAFTFVRFFTIFILVIVAFSLCFCVVLKPPGSPGNDIVLTNFESPFTSFMKTLQMLRGGFSIEPYTFKTNFEKLLFLIFLITSFVLFNLINGLAIRDIAMLKEQAEYLNLRQQIRNAAESESFLSKIYWKVNGNSDGDIWWRRFIIYLMSLPIRKFPNLHKMDNLLIDFKAKTVQYEHDQKKFDVLQTRSGQPNKYILDDVSLKKFREIVAKRQPHEGGVEEKVDALQAQIIACESRNDEKFEALQSSNDEIKKLLLQVLAEH